MHMLTKDGQSYFRDRPGQCHAHGVHASGVGERLQLADSVLARVSNSSAARSSHPPALCALMRSHRAS